MKRLPQLIEANYMAGKWKAIPLTRGDTRLSHLMLADDVVLLGEASREQAQTIKNFLQELCEASGQKVSMQKSSVYFSPNMNKAVIAEVCNTLGIQQTDDFGHYLGVPAINGRVTKARF